MGATPREDGRHPQTELASDFAVVVFGPFNAEGGRSWFFLDTENLLPPHATPRLAPASIEGAKHHNCEIGS